MEIRSLGFRTDVMVLALGGSELEHHDRHLVVRTPTNPTYWWGNFVLFSEPVAAGDIPRRLALYDDAFPDVDHVAWGIDTVDGTAGVDQALVDAGFSIGRDTVLTATELAAPARPTAASLRLLASEDDWRQALELRVACSDFGGGVTLEFTVAKVEEARRLCELGYATWYGAFEGGLLRSALGLVTDGGELARYQIVETHPDARRRGLAGNLIHRAGADALARGAKTLVIVADPDYHAIGLYRSLGFVDTETQVQLTRAPVATGA